MKRLGFTIIKNAAVNVVRGGTTAMVALALPHFLTRALDHNHFAAWVLMVQIAAYASYFDFGLQTAVARYFAQAMERGDSEQRDRLVSTAIALLAGGGLLAFTVIGTVIFFLPHLFHQLPMTLGGELRAGLFVMAAAAALSMPMSAFTGVLVGLHRNEFPALAIGVSRILGAIALLVTVRFTQSLLWLALCLGVFNLIGGMAQCVMAAWILPEMRVRLGYLSRGMAHTLVRYCFSLTIYSFSMFLISGLDVTIVGYFNFSAVGYYAISATLITFMAGLSSAVFTAMMTPVAVLQTRGEIGRIRDLVISTTRLSNYASLAITLPVFAYGSFALTLWVGPAYATQALPILEVLLVAQAIRLTGTSYCTMLIATGQQKFGVGVALIEAFTNVIFSVAGAFWFGPIGVAWGTLVGALIAVICLFPLSVSRATEVPIPAWLFLREGILLPLSAATPLILFFVFMGSQNPSPSKLWGLILATLTSIFMAITYGKLRPQLLIGQP